MNDPKWVVKFEDTVHDVAIRKYGYAATPLGTGVRLWLARNAPQFYGLARSIRRAALGGRRRAPRSAGSHIKDVASRSIGMDLVLEAYWVGEPVGPGPGASLLARNDEVMRFDCLVNNAHMHLNMNRARRLGAGSARIYFVPGATRAHMERAAHELVHNTAYALAVNDDRAIRALRPATEQLEEAAEWMVAHWLELARARQLDVGDSDKHAGKLVHRTLERASAGAEVVQSPQSGREP